MPQPSITIDMNEYRNTLKGIEGMDAKMVDRKLRSILRRNIKPMTAEMKHRAPTRDNDSILDNIGVTTARKWVGKSGAIRVGVISDKNKRMKNFSAQALASVLEYGSAERFRRAQSTFGIITALASTGRVEARPFLRPAYDNNIGGLVAGVERDIEREVNERG
jgi:hypothetical protein